MLPGRGRKAYHPGTLCQKMKDRTMLQDSATDRIHPDALSTRDNRTLTRIYQHPLSHNLELRDVTALFDAIGQAEPLHNGEIRLSVGYEALTLVRPHSKDLTADEVILLRHFLDRTGWSPNAPQTVEEAAPDANDMVIVIDHAGARIHHLGTEREAGHTDTVGNARHLLHETYNKDPDKDRKETWPADQRFFADVADLVQGAGRIVVISHGTGQSNEADHLMSWLDSHRKDVRALISRQIVADLPHMSEPELLALAAHVIAELVSDSSATV